MTDAMASPEFKSPQGGRRKPPLSISFHNFWASFVATDSFFVKALGARYDVTVSAVGRDIQFSSVFGRDPLPTLPGGRALRVWWTGEAMEPRWQIFDLHFGFRPASFYGARWHRLPLWVHDIDWWDPQSPLHIARLTAPRAWQERPRFCNFIYGNPTSLRAEFFLRLNAERPVDSLGRVLNNAGGWRPPGRQGKMDILARSRFTIAFENQQASGYVTEKLLEPLIAGSIPIYWGASEAKTDFNPRAFLFAEDFGSFAGLVKEILRLDDSAEAMAAFAAEPPFLDNRIAPEHTPDFFVDRISEALSGNLALGIPSEWRQHLTGQEKSRRTELVRWRRRLRGRLRDWFRRLRRPPDRLAR